MAKKPATKQPAKPGPEAGYMQTIIISGVIFVLVIVAGVLYSSYRSNQLEKAAQVQVQQAASEEPTVSIPGVTGSRNAAESAAHAAATAAANAARGAAQAAATVAAAATVTPSDPAVRCRAIMTKEVDSKANIWRIDYEDAKYLYDSGAALFIDARGANEYAEAHIKGSINIPVNTTKEELARMSGELADKVLVTYCHGIGCHLSDKTAYLLFDSGYKKVAIFFGGWPKWNEHNGPIDKK